MAGSGGSDASQGGADTGSGGSGDPMGQSGRGVIEPIAGSDGGAGAPNVVSCEGFSEADDSGNAAIAPDASGDAEATGSNVVGGVTICGHVDVDHFGSGVVDVDSFGFNVSQATEAYVTLEFAGEVPAELVELVVVGADDTSERTTAALAHGVAVARLPVGAATVSVVVENAAALPARLPYVLQVRSYDSSSRCPHVTDPPLDLSYAEALDGAMHTGNDFVRPSAGVETQSLTSNVSDAVEDADWFLQSGEKGLIRGEVADVSHGDAYADGDMYEVRAFGDKVTLRLDWTDQSSDLHLWVFEENRLRPIARGIANVSSTTRFVTFSLNSGVPFWVWVGATGTSTSLPEDYDLSVCAQELGD